MIRKKLRAYIEKANGSRIRQRWAEVLANDMGYAGWIDGFGKNHPFPRGGKNPQYHEDYIAKQFLVPANSGPINEAAVMTGWIKWAFVNSTCLVEFRDGPLAAPFATMSELVGEYVLGLEEDEGDELSFIVRTGIDGQDAKEHEIKPSKLEEFLRRMK